jgi:alpha-1,3-rhamnosyl/mannosyltransferase
VAYLGHVADEELAVLYRAAVAHVIVSRLEGFGLTVVEAMASGCPIIATEAGSLAEVAGDAAITVDPEDASAIGAAIERLLQSNSLRAELIERGRARAPRFSRQAQAVATAEVYRRFFETL